MLILGIETSCDETAAAVVEDGRTVHSNVISSQIELHQAYGGVVPELAARGQIEAIIPVIKAAMAEAMVTFDDIGAIAYTQGPGLAGSLLVGVNAAKALGFALGKPLVPVNHLEGHVHANWLIAPNQPEAPAPALPAVCLLVSGGHTMLIEIRDGWNLEVLGQTLDDAAGEAFDKGARLLGLGYPGGPAIQQVAVGLDRDRFPLPRAALPATYNFSFSGLKTALQRAAQPYRREDDALPAHGSELFPRHRPATFVDAAPIADLAASFEGAVVDALLTKTIEAAKTRGARSILLAGGVAANALLRRNLADMVSTGWSDHERPFVGWPDLAYCTDNAAMIAGRGFARFTAGGVAGPGDDALPRNPIVSTPEKRK